MKDIELDKLVKGIEKATNGTFVGRYGSTTLLGWTPKFDELGRPLNCDPNYIDSSVNIQGIDYHITKKGWNVWIWNPNYKNGGYLSAMGLKGNDLNEDKVLCELDLTPDYVKEYYKNK